MVVQDNKAIFGASSRAYSDDSTNSDYRRPNV